MIYTEYLVYTSVSGIIILALIAKYVEHWRYIQLALNIPTLATVLYIWYELSICF